MRKLRLMPALMAVLLAGCAAGGSASSTLPAGQSGAAKTVPPGPSGGVRHTESGPSCSGAGGSSFVGGAGSNVAHGGFAGVLAGYGNQACDDFTAIDGGSDNSISSSGDTATSSWIGGGFENTITGNGYYAALGGGSQNTITAAFSFVGSGQDNNLSGEYGVIGGGYLSNVSGEYGTVGGGSGNTASAEWATVAGGNNNTASGNGANVSGGANNVASGPHATVLGGSRNIASGPQSLAAGVQSYSEAAGDFVWSDDSANASTLIANTPNVFLARASGGFTLWTNATNTVGATLAAGSGAWASASDRNMKTNVVGVDDAEVLDRVGRLPINRWSYVTEHGVRHVGPMAQDFYAAFNVGADDRHITAIDEDGVALAAIKALRTQNATLRARQATMERQIARLDAMVRRLARDR
jgi:hypothetical protein